MNQYPPSVIILPLEGKVLLPSVLLRLMIRGNQANDLTKVYFRQASSSTSSNTPMPDLYVACIPVKPASNKIMSHNPEGDQLVSQAPQHPLPFYQDNKSKADDGLLLSDDHRQNMARYGCLARIVRVQRSGTNLFGVFVEGLARFGVNSIHQNALSMTPYPGSWMANVMYFNDDSRLLKELSIQENHLVVMFKELSQIFVVKMKELQLPDSLIQQLSKVVNTKPVSSLADLLVSLIETTFEERLRMLIETNLNTRLRMASEWLTRQLHVLQISDKLGTGIDGALGKRQREFYLRQQVTHIYIAPFVIQLLSFIYL